MNFTSSYADGAPQMHDGSVLPAPKPQRMHWSTLLLTGGMGLCFVALLATLAGVPASLGYDPDGPATRNKPNTSDPLKLTQSLDGNMKWIADSSGDGEGEYLGLIKSINRSEAAIPAMMAAMASMDASVKAIDAGLGGVYDTTIAMRDDMRAMAEVSGASAATMDSLGDDIGFLSASMLSLAGTTEELTSRMAGVERKASGIARNHMGTALDSARDLNATLPDDVPAPVLEGGGTLRLPGATGAGAGAAAPTSDALPPRPGAQPPRGDAR